MISYIVACSALAVAVAMTNRKVATSVNKFGNDLIKKLKK